MTTAIRLFILLVLLFAAMAAPEARADGAEVKRQNEPELTAEDLLQFEHAPDAPDFSTGTEEKIHLQTMGSDYDIPRQKRFSGIDDAVFEQRIFNKHIFMAKNSTTSEDENHNDELVYSSISDPDVWLLSVHYPKSTGHSFVDAFLKQQATRFFMDTLAVDPEKISALTPEEWLASQKFPDDDLWKRPLAEAFAETRRQILNGDNPDEGDRKFYWAYRSVTTYIITQPKAAYLSVVFTRERDWGGAHNNWISKVFSFDLKTGKLLQTSDLFTGTPKQLAALQKRLGELAVEAGVDDFDCLPKAFQVMVNDPKKTPLNMQKIALTRDGLVFIYDPYEIASYGQGTIMLTVPAKELKRYGVNTRFWQGGVPAAKQAD